MAESGEGAVMYVIHVNGKPCVPKRWTLEVHRHMPPHMYFGDPSTPLSAAVEVEGTLTLDHDAYEAYRRGFAPRSLHTVTFAIDLNPWHRSATGPRARLRRWRDIASWEFRRRVLRRAVLSTAETTFPNCRLVDDGETSH